ncbi:MAG: hypothetical protein QGG68_08160 [SAR324 cluster bacterium]|jgi:hypothetical protein|nr:hypothetical protein [SAR324 cluster bacterium]|tara:strand:+ start:2023 stop:2157 length:135 start_codon:yes stop_codon:yes gene_type:complete
MKPTIILAGPAVNVNEKTSGNMSVRDIVKKIEPHERAGDLIFYK